VLAVSDENVAQTNIIERNRVVSSITPKSSSSLADAVLSSSSVEDSLGVDSSSFNSSDLAEYIYNRKIPEIYRIADDEVSTDRDLNRFLHVGIEGGLDDTLDKVASIKNLVDPLTCKAKFLPLLASSWGLQYTEDIGVYFNRKFLSCIGEFMKRRSTMGGVKYIIRILTGFDSELRYERVSTGEKQGRYLYYTIKLDSIKALNRLEISEKALSHFIKENVPFYITDIYNGASVYQDEKVNTVTQNVFCVSSNFHYDLVTEVIQHK
jgi:hypothetical protein